MLFLVLLFQLSTSSPDAASIRGTVVDPDNAPVAHARVFLTARTAVVSSALTDARGEFVIAQVPPGSYDVIAVREGFRAIPAHVDVTTDRVPPVTVRLQVSALEESLVISAAHVEQPLSLTPATTTVITREDIRTFQHESVAAALRRVPGVSIASNGGTGSVTSLFSRGGESDFTAVAIDGVPVNAFGGSFNFGGLTTGGVERVEVVRGPQSALWSGAAVGGIVQIITRPDAGRRLFDGYVDAGSRGSYRAAALASVPTGPWHMTFGGERASSDGFDGTTRTGEQVTNDDWTAEHVNIGLRRDGETRLQFTSRWERGERGYPGPFGSDPGGTYPGLDRVSRGIDRSVMLGASGSRVFSRVRPSVYASWYRLDSDFASPYGESESSTRRGSVRAQADLRISASLDATVGGEWLGEEATSTFITATGGERLPVQRSIASAFGEARLDARTVLLTAGARIERVRRASLPSDDQAFSPRVALPEDIDVAVTPRVSASWFARPATADGEWTRVRASGGLGIRPPDAFELAFTDNPALAPERTRSLEAGIEHALARGLIVAEATGFFNRYDDLIVTVGRSVMNASQYVSDNISNAESRGIELLVSARARAGFRAAIAYTYLDTRILALDGLGVAAPPFTVGDPLLRRPRHLAWADAAWSGGAASAFVTVGARGRTLDVDPNFGAFGGVFANSGYASVDAGGAWRATGQVEIFGRATNLFDREYEEVLGFPAARRGLYAGVRVSVR